MKMMSVLFAAALSWSSANAAPMLEINYIDQDPDGVSYPSRILVTERFMRMDSGKEGENYLILDRRNGRISNVTPERQEILRVDPGKVLTGQPKPWRVREKITALPSRGPGAKQVQIYVNDKLCSTITAIPNVFPDAVNALREYRRTLRAVQGDTYDGTPPELRNQCDLAQHVFETDRGLRFGLPLEETYQGGKTRRIVNYREVESRPELFVLPEDYHVIDLMKLRRGADTR